MLFFKINSSDVYVSYRLEWFFDFVFGLQILDKYVDCVSSNEQIWDFNYIFVFYRIIKIIIESIKGGMY